ncbi:MAG TPA: PQQ-binding-like beta-propeller repeat protein [Gemmataceae bacterium]|nr:PQQ-binding-like beta-propeller repeat protein [Gemmataceae bacterium]
MRRFCLAFLLTFAPALALSAADWPQFLGPNRDGHSAETKLNWDWTGGGPPVAWKLDIGTGWAGPVVAGERLILFHRVGAEEIVACLDPMNGKEKWTFRYPTKYSDDFGFDDGPRATPLIAENRIFILGANGDLHAIELASGQKLWHRNLRADYAAPKGFFGVACSPLLAGGKLLVNVGAKGAGIVAFDPATGKEAWKATDDPASYSSPTVAEIGGKTLAVFLTREGLVALEPETGKVRFTHPWRPRLNESVNAATPLVWKDEIFLSVSYSTGGILLRAKGDALEEVWSNDRSLSCHYNTPVRVGEYLYGVHGRQEGGGAKLRCVEWKTGAVKWSVDRFGVASLLAVDGGLLALTEAGELIRFDASPDAFRERGRAAILGSPTRAAPALADGRLFARDGGKLVCVKLK